METVQRIRIVFENPGDNKEHGTFSPDPKSALAGFSVTRTH